MTPTEAAKLIASNAALRSQLQKMKDAHDDFVASQNRLLEALEPLVRQARTVLDEHCREAENVVKLRPSITLPTERQT